MILIDSDIAVDIWRAHADAIAWLGSIGTEEIVVPGYVAMELLKGCRNAGELLVAERILGQFRMAWPDAASCAAAYEIYKRIHFGNAIGILDCLIGQCALTLRLPLYTFNQKHFKAIPGLTTLQPYLK